MQVFCLAVSTRPFLLFGSLLLGPVSLLQCVVWVVQVMSAKIWRELTGPRGASQAAKSAALLSCVWGESPFCCSLQWTMGTFLGSQMASNNVKLSSLFLIFLVEVRIPISWYRAPYMWAVVKADWPSRCAVTDLSFPQQNA